MRAWWTLAAAGLVASFAMQAGAQTADTERLLLDRLHFTADDVARARQGEPVARLLPSSRREEIAIAGAVRVDGDPQRLAHWIENIEHFRNAAELGAAHLIQPPATAATFAALNLAPEDVDDLRQCGAGTCAVRISTDAAAALQGVPWKTSAATEQASAILRDMLAVYTRAYAAGERTPSAEAFHGLLSRAPVVGAIAPEVVEYFNRFPATAPVALNGILYWSAMPQDRGTTIAIHHLAVSRRPAGDVVIVDRLVYASRYFDAGAVVITMMPTTGGYFLVAGSRLESPDLASLAARVARRQIERSALDLVRMYMGWIRESLATAATP